MMKIGETIQSGDFKGEKHVPVIEAPAKVKAGEKFDFYMRTILEARDIRGRIERHIDRCSWPGTVYAEA